MIKSPGDEARLPRDAQKDRQLSRLRGASARRENEAGGLSPHPTSR